MGVYVQPGEKFAPLHSIDAVEIGLPLSTDQFTFLDSPPGAGRSTPA